MKRFERILPLVVAAVCGFCLAAACHELSRPLEPWQSRPAPRKFCMCPDLVRP